MRGLVTRAIPMLVRLACPPEMPLCMALPILRFWHGSRASNSIMCVTRSLFSSRDWLIGSFNSAVYSSISLTVRLSTSVSACPAALCQERPKCFERAGCLQRAYQQQLHGLLSCCMPMASTNEAVMATWRHLKQRAFRIYACLHYGSIRDEVVPRLIMSSPNCST